MGRMIGGTVVGFIAALLAAAILSIIFIFVLGTKNIVEPETFAPTSMYLGILLVLGIAIHYLGSAIARAIGKDKKTVYYYVGLLVVLGVVGIAMSGGEKKIPENMPKASMDMSPFIASFYAQIHLPSWFNFVTPITGIVGALLGGMSKSDVVKPASAPQG